MSKFEEEIQEMAARFRAGVARTPAERAAVDERGRALEGLDQIGLERVAEHGGHSSVGFQIGGCDRLTLGRLPNEYASEPLLQLR